MIPFLRFFPKRQAPPAVIPVQPKAAPFVTGMTQQKWFASPEHANALREAFRAHPVLRDWLSVAWSEIPVLQKIPTDCKPTAAVFAAGKTSGHIGCLELLEQCLAPRYQSPQIPVTYEQSVEDAFAPKE